VTRKVFWDDPYLTRLDVIISGIPASGVTLDRTIFHPFSGGQECDRGTLGERRILDARWEGREILHILDHAEGLSVGDSLVLKIDWERRYALMRLHFAAELVLETVRQALPSIRKIGAHIAADKARIDFSWPQNLAPLLPAIQERVGVLVAGDHAITSGFSDEANERRFWELPGFARVACGGTHLRRTGEVGPLRLRRDNIGRGKERIEIFLGR
jgi:Ser-tRNA(Ala) deacylase AlaX